MVSSAEPGVQLSCLGQKISPDSTRRDEVQLSLQSMLLASVCKSQISVQQQMGFSQKSRTHLGGLQTAFWSLLWEDIEFTVGYIILVVLTVILIGKFALTE